METPLGIAYLGDLPKLSFFFFFFPPFFFFLSGQISEVQ